MNGEGKAGGLDWPRMLGALLAAAVLGIVLGFAIFAQLGQRASAPDAQAQVLAVFALGVLFGSLVTAVFFWMRGRQTQNSWFYVALFSLAIMAIAAARADQMSFVQASLIIVFGSVALVAAASALSLFRQGEAIELESNWGGLGGALGGWRLSPATSLILSAFLFACGAIVAGQGQVSRNQATATAETKAGSDTKDTKGNKGGTGAPQAPGQTTPPPATTPQPGAVPPAQGKVTP